MQWKLFANLAETAGQKEVPLDPEGELTVREALEALFERHPELESAVLTESGDLQEHIRLLVDGTDPFAEADGYETTVDESTELALFPPVSGG